MLQLHGAQSYVVASIRIMIALSTDSAIERCPQPLLIFWLWLV